MFPLMRCDLEDPIHRRCIAAAIAKDEDHADYLRHGVVELGVSRDATNTLREISTNDAIFPEAL